MPTAVLLTGDHATLPRAELEAQCGPAEWVGDRVALLKAEDGLRRLAYLREAGDLWAVIDDTPEAIQAAAAQVPDWTDGQGRAAVAALRTGQDKSPNRHLAERTLGGALADAGHPIDLQDPEVVVFCWFHAGRIVIGRRRHTAWQDFDARKVEHRAHFSPVSLRPRLAAALVHLTGARPPARIYDPFCGTGGILLEAALDGYTVLGSDRDPWMVQGSLATLTDEGPEPLDGDVFVADIGDVPDLVDVVDAIVTDLPYGGASTTNMEPLHDLYGRAFAAFAALLAPGARAVIGHADPDALAPIAAHGFEVEAVHEEYVHKSLTRRFAVVRKRQTGVH